MPSNTPVLSEKSKTAKLASSPPTYRKTDMRRSTSGCSFPKNGSPTITFSAGKSAVCLKTRFSGPNPNWLVEMLNAVNQENGLPFKYVLADSIYGISPDFIAAVESLPDKTYLVSVPKDTRCWLKRPMTITRAYRWGGKTRTKTLLVDPDSKPLTLEELAQNINDYFWYRRQVSEGSKGPIVYEFTRRRVILSTAGLPQKPSGC